MANVPSTDKQIAIVGSLAEGSSIRSIKRIIRSPLRCSPLFAVRAVIVQEFRSNAPAEA